jgi:hypothetical protein
MLHRLHVELGRKLPVGSNVVLGVIDGPDLLHVFDRQPLRIAGNEDWFVWVQRVQVSQVMHEILGV